MLTFPEAGVGAPLRHEALSVFPLLAEPDSHRRGRRRFARWWPRAVFSRPARPRSPARYLLSDEALATGAVTVTEVSASGSVPDLRVDNRCYTPVLFLEGEELRGAKQNRVVNTSVLVAAQSRATLPVSCVEQGRWDYQSALFRSGGGLASPKLRHVLKESIYRSVLGGKGHGSDQGRVWEEVGRQMESLGSHSATGAMADTYDRYRDRMAEFRGRLRCAEAATGVAVAVGGKLVSVDLFDKPATCRKAWDRMLTGVVLDALEAARARENAGAADAQGVSSSRLGSWQSFGAQEPAGVADVRGALATLSHAPWREGAAIGAGREFAAKLAGGRYASALVCGGAVLHGSLVTAG